MFNLKSKEVFTKNLQRLTKSKTAKTRYALQSVQVSDDGTATATDSHVLYQIDNLFPELEAGTYDLNNNENTTGNITYPNTESILSSILDADLGTFSFQVVEMYDVIRAIELMSDKQYFKIVFDESNSTVTFQTDNDEKKVSYSIHCSEAVDNVVYVDIKKFKELVKMLKDAKMHETVNVHFTESPYKPLGFSAEGFKAVISPIRVMN